MLLSTQILFQIEKAHEAVEVGGTYYLAVDRNAGGMVTVLSKSIKPNASGWPSSVEVKTLEPIPYIGAYAMKLTHEEGKVLICSAQNLFLNREAAMPRQVTQSRYRSWR